MGRAAAPGRSPAVLILTREAAIPVRNAVTVAMLTSTIRDIPVEVRLGQDDGLPDDCVINCDNLLTVPQALLTDYECTLSTAKLGEVSEAVYFALELPVAESADQHDEPCPEECCCPMLLSPPHPVTRSPVHPLSPSIRIPHSTGGPQ